MSISVVPGPGGSLWIGRYERIERIGQGPTCEVHLARTVRRDGEVALVALKLALPELAQDAAFVERFLASARRAEMLMHPGIARVLDVSQDPDVPYVAAEYVHGEHVGAILRRLGPGERPLDILLRVIALAAQALDHAHGARTPLVHGSLTPQNLFVQYDGEVRVADFCAPRAPLGPADASSREHGGVAYWSPEQASGRPVDTSSDVFSLGAVMWECLTQRPLFAAGTRAETLERVKTCDVRPPSELVDCPAALDRIVRRCLDKEPRNRPATAGALSEELDVLLERRRRDASPAAIRALMHDVFSQRQAGRDATLRRALHPSRESYAPLAAASPSLVPPAARGSSKESRPRPPSAGSVSAASASASASAAGPASASASAAAPASASASAAAPASASAAAPASASASAAAPASASASPPASASAPASAPAPASASASASASAAAPASASAAAPASASAAAPTSASASTSAITSAPASASSPTPTVSATPVTALSPTVWVVAIAAICLLCFGALWAMNREGTPPPATVASEPGTTPAPLPTTDRVPGVDHGPDPAPDPVIDRTPDPVVDPDPLAAPDPVPAADPDPLPDPDAVPEPAPAAAPTLRPQDMASLEVVCRPAAEIFLENRSLGLSPRVIPVVPGTLAVGLRSTGPEHRWRTVRRDVEARGTLSVGLADCP